MSSITHRRGRALNSMDINKRTFMAQQDRKKRKWKREDEVRLAGMNLPSLSPDNLERSPSIDVMYHSSDNEPRSDSASFGRKPILPMMKLHKERTEIILHHDRTVITRLPPFVEIDQNIQTVFDAYRGKAFLSRDLPSRDDRFTRLQMMLTPSARSRSEEYPLENTMSRSKPKKHNQLNLSADSPAMSEPSSMNYHEARVLIASRGQSRDCTRNGIEFFTETKSAKATRPAEILHSFKTQDLNELSKTLTRESHIDPSLVQEPTFVRRSSVQKDPTFVTKARPSIHVPSLGLNYEVKNG